MRRRKDKPYRIIGAYDSETTNINGSSIFAFPVVHQLGLIDCPVEEITSDNVQERTCVQMYRHAVDLYATLDDLASGLDDYVPVICCHNLAFDMYGLSPWLDGHDVKVLAKSQRKPITFTVLDDAGKSALVLWDTLVFSGQSLERMGEDAGFEKAVGKWDYDLIRTPESPLTDDELVYAKDDIYTLLAWLGWWLRRNPEIEPEKLARNVMTKTGVVRERRKIRFSGLKHGKHDIGRQWYFINRQQAPKSDDELYTMQACTRGGFTFCASKFASIPFDFTGSSKVIAGFDATSQHPAQMVSHRYPTNFHETSPEVLELAFDIIGTSSYNDILRKWSKPFVRAFNAAFTFENLRPKPGTLFAEYGIFPLASARFRSAENRELDEDNGDSISQDENRRNRGYCDTADNPEFAFGKLVRADRCTVYITELAAWEIFQSYKWDSVHAEHGYIAGRFIRPSDMSIVSVMQFYQAKNQFKQARAEYLKFGLITNDEGLKATGFPESLIAEFNNGTLSRTDLEAEYLNTKSNLNSLFGIEASNEYRRDTVLTPNGIEYTGEMGICNAPKNPKAWYQFGQRIVGWSRIAQICAMYLVYPNVAGIVNGDTDSIKVICRESDIGKIKRSLSRLARAIDNGKKDNCYRVRGNYHEYFDELEGIGYYELEFTAKRFCAAWNKAYCIQDENGFEFTLAGIPTRDRYVKVDDSLQLESIRLDGFASRMLDEGMQFGEITDSLLGYNVTIAHDLTGLNARKFPAWGDIVCETVTDYLGNTAKVVEPAALALYPMPKTIGSFGFADNRSNARYATRNRPTVNTNRLIISKHGIVHI